mmetsp:Transcript_8823/g.12606  ORF Transcript_8823/g.12606 Transcript_8823/m.12606 type:complete len:400 (-) Transcript_8823:96-1295(-)
MRQQHHQESFLFKQRNHLSQKQNYKIRRRFFLILAIIMSTTTAIRMTSVSAMVLSSFSKKSFRYSSRLPPISAPILSSRTNILSSSWRIQSNSKWNYSCNRHVQPFTCRYLSTTTNNDNENTLTKEKSIEKAQEIISLLVTSKNNRTWRRLSHFIYLATPPSTTPPPSTTTKTIADIGCDHGLLSLGLASTQHFKKVIGVDVSPQALSNALQNLNTLQKQHSSSSTPPPLPIEFRVGNGLTPLTDDEKVNIICLAGMGVHSMMNILNLESLTKIECEQIIVQPTNSRPQHLLLLYKRLFEDGWRLEEECIEFMDQRWYITSSFVLKKEEEEGVFLLPGDYLSSKKKEKDEQIKIYKEYVRHHVAWMKENLQQRTLHKDTNRHKFEEDDMKWLELNQRLL